MNVIYIFIAIFLVFFSKIIFRFIINPISIYILFFSLTFLLNLINVVGMIEADYTVWLIFILSFFSFALGNFIGLILKNNKNYYYILDDKKLQKIIKLLFLFSSISIGVNLFVLINHYGGIVNYIHNMNKIYVSRINSEIHLFHIPYFPSLALLITLLASINLYDIKYRWYVSALLLVFLDSLYNAGRTEIFIAILFIINLFLLKFNFFNTLKKIKSLIIIFLISFSILYLTNLIRDLRGGFENYNVPDNQIIKFLEKIGIYRPSLYVYIACSPSVLSQAIKNENILNKYPFSNFFYPLAKFIYKLDNINLPKYQPMVDIGIREANTGTYLEAIYFDFGIIGIFIINLIIGFISGRLFKNFIKYKSSYYFLFLNLILVYIEMGIFFNLLRTGYFFITIIGSLLIAFLARKKIYLKG